MEITFDQDPLAVEQNNLTKIVNVYIAYNLDDCPKFTFRRFTLKTVCLERLIL